MSESLFEISCPSCESVFAVTEPELVGQIIACPKCGGMMLVEARQTAKNAEDAQNSENTPNDEAGEAGQNAVSFPSVEEPALEETAENARLGEDASNAGDSGDGEESEEGAAAERSRSGGKLIAGGVALALVGALAFGGLRVFKNESAPTSQAGVEAENSENVENGELGEGAEEETSGAKDDVGEVALFAVEERTGEEKEETGGPFDDAVALGESEDGTFGETDEVGANDGIAEDAQDLSVATDDADGKTSLESENREDSDLAQNGGNGEDGENEESGEDGALETKVEIASPLDEADDGLDDLGDLGDLGDLKGTGDEDELDAEANEGLDALDAVDEEPAEGRKFAGSNKATGFNEADFERANQNADPENADEAAEVDWSGVASTTTPTLQGALPTLRRERKEIDVDARLALPIKSIEFPSSPVAAIRLLSEFTGVSIVPELETFVLTRPSTNATLDLALRDATAGEALEKVAELLNWEVCKEKDRILIRPSGADPEAIVEERFDVADLTTNRAEKSDETRLEMFELPNNLTSETLAAFIKSTVAPETWEENDARAALTVDGTTFALAQNAWNREKARVLLDGLRAIRGLEPQGEAAPERIVPEKLGWEKLTKKTTFAPLTPVALQNAVEILEKAQKFQAFWDDAALIEAGVGRDSTTAARIENGTLDAVLNEILEPLNAAYVILGENLILVTSQEAAKDYQTVEFFSLVGESGARPTLAEARALVEEIKQAVDPESWKRNEGTIGEFAQNEAIIGNDADEENNETSQNAQNEEETESASNEGVEGNGENSGFGKTLTDGQNAVVWLDVESSCLIIRQSQPNQRAIRRWLAARLSKSPSPNVESVEKINQKTDEF